ncbi:hypothetical protein GCM10028857_04610 [Salinarchaeum chitinilyticum]
MGDKNLTLFAFHTHGETQFGPSSIPGVEAEADDADEETAVEVTEEESSGGGGLGALLIALVVLAGIAVVAKKLTGDDDSVDLAESDEL